MSDFEHISAAPEDVPPETAVAEELAGQAPDETPEGWVARLKGLDFVKEHRTAIIAVGAAAVAVGVGAYALSKRGDKAGQFFVDFADRRAREQGVISLGEIAEGGAAVSVPVSEAAYTALEKAKGTGTTMKALFAMTGQQPNGESGDFAYPLTGDQDHVRKHGETARRAASWLMQHLSQRAAEPKN